MITEMTSISQCWSTSFTKNNVVSNITLTQHSCLDSYGKFSVSRELKTGQAFNTQSKKPIALFLPQEISEVQVFMKMKQNIKKCQSWVK